MAKLTDQEYLLIDQYRTASNLNARIQLHARFSTNNTGWHRWVFDQFNFPAECRVLELGCGPGDLWRENLDRIPGVWEVTLSDFSPGMLQEAEENLRGSGHHFEFRLVDAQEIPFEGASFDGVIANHMLYHVPDAAKALSEIRRVLRPGGRFYASTVGRTHMNELHDLVSRFDPDDKVKAAHATPSFLLENGSAQLSPYFSQVTLRRYDDDLVITEAKPLVAYVLSMAEARSVFIDERLIALIKYVEREIAAHAAIRITKDSGLFEAFRDDCD